jgi:hypothetical protein
MDIITDFGSVVGGSSPSGCTKRQPQHESVAVVAFWHPEGLEKLLSYDYEVNRSNLAKRYTGHVMTEIPSG